MRRDNKRAIYLYNRCGDGAVNLHTQIGVHNLHHIYNSLPCHTLAALRSLRTHTLLRSLIALFIQCTRLLQCATRITTSPPLPHLLLHYVNFSSLLPSSCQPSPPLSSSISLTSSHTHRVVYSLIIINKAGGLVYNRTFTTFLSSPSVNDLLVLAGTFHGVHAITKSLTPSALHAAVPANQRTGIEVLESSTFRLSCFQTFTGTKFLLFTEPQQANVDVLLRKVYELYSDYVMKNPFYQLEMPVRCEAFDRHLLSYLRAK